MSYILKKAAPLNIEFNRKVQFLHYNGEKFIVYSTLNGNESDVMEFSDIGDVTKRKDKCLHMDMADIVIVTLPSVQTKNLAGHFLPDFVNKDLGAKYLGFFSSRSLKMREKYTSFVQFACFLREVCLILNF